MNKPNLAQIAKSIRASLIEHSPEILTGIGIAGMVTTTILAVKATPRAIELIKADSKKNHDDDPHAYTKSEAIKSCWKCYIPAAVTGASSIACIIGGCSVNTRRNAALATAYTLSETALKEYKGKVIETFGEKKEQVVLDSIAKDRIDKNPVSQNKVFVTGKGKTRCYDWVSGRYFESDADKIKKAEIELNRQILADMYVSLNEFYDLLGLDPIGIGDDLGWNVDCGTIELYFSAQLDDEETPCLVLHYNVAPKYNYQKIY